MAGGKETPRQKMIGMMYLVLTALLALNVSSTVIDKFVFLNDSLVKANNETEERNIAIQGGITKTVEETGNRPDDMKVVNASNEIRTETARVLKELIEIKKTMVDITGGYEEGHNPEYPGDAKHLVGKTDYDKVGHHMMPKEEGGEGRGVELKSLLNGYSEFVRSRLKELGASEAELAAYKPIALDADDDPVYSTDPNQKGKAFAALAFENSPTPAGLATVSELGSRVLGYETRALDFLSSKVGAGDLTFDVIVPMVKPESKYVAAGTKYSAKLFLSAASSAVTPTMKYDGKDIPVDANGQGLVEFVATASSFDKEGLARKTYEAEITVAGPGGRDTTFVQQMEYFVVRPTISIQSQSVQALYLNCGNKLDVQVPQLGVAYNPSFTAKNAVAYEGSEKGAVTVVPNSLSTVTLNVSSSGNYIGSRDFAVRRIPQPTIMLGTDQGAVDMKGGLAANTPRLYIQAVPDESFKQFLPEDSKFRVAEAQITLVSGGLGRGSITVGAQANLGQIPNARKGDAYVIEIKRVQRQNFRGKVEDFPIAQRFYTVTLK